VHGETPTAKTFRLRLASASHHLSGQHYIVRLTAPDGYTAARSYSVASAPEDSADIEITVERLPGGEVSMFLHDEVQPGDELEVRGPIGGWFIWGGDTPALLIGGGSGVVPLMAMLRLARRSGTNTILRLVVSVRDPQSLYYAEELPGPEVTIAYTRSAPPSTTRPPGRITADDLPMLPAGAFAYICGSSPFAEAASDLALHAGCSLERIRIERFGPTG
jgi:ferredoxin-NADP reductase